MSRYDEIVGILDKLITNDDYKNISIQDMAKLRVCGKRLLKEVERLSAHIEQLESELAKYREAEQDGRLVVLPPKSKYGDATLDDAIRGAS